ncbi:MAG: hypothetical protein ACYTBJ_21370, partial [Planctomycetota bacterium]
MLRDETGKPVEGPELADPTVALDDKGQPIFDILQDGRRVPRVVRLPKQYPGERQPGTVVKGEVGLPKREGPVGPPTRAQARQQELLGPAAPLESHIDQPWGRKMTEADTAELRALEEAYEARRMELSKNLYGQPQIQKWRENYHRQLKSGEPFMPKGLQR